MEEVFAGITGSRRAAAEPAPAVAAEVSAAPAAAPAAANATSKAEPQVDAPVTSADDDAGRSLPVVSTAEMDIVSALPRTADLEQTSSIGR